MFSLSRWSPKHLLAAWSAYWVGLAIVTIGPIVWRTMGVALPEENKGSVSAGFNNGEFTVSIVNAGVTVWNSVTPFSTIAFWIAVPPLALWGVWLFTRPRRPLPLDRTTDRPTPGELGPGSMDQPSRARGEPIPERRDES